MSTNFVYLSNSNGQHIYRVHYQSINTNKVDQCDYKEDSLLPGRSINKDKSRACCRCQSQDNLVIVWNWKAFIWGFLSKIKVLNQTPTPKWCMECSTPVIRAVSRKYSKIWFWFTSEIKVEQENYRNEKTVLIIDQQHGYWLATTSKVATLSVGVQPELLKLSVNKIIRWVRGNERTEV